MKIAFSTFHLTVSPSTLNILRIKHFVQDQWTIFANKVIFHQPQPQLMDHFFIRILFCGRTALNHWTIARKKKKTNTNAYTITNTIHINYTWWVKCSNLLKKLLYRFTRTMSFISWKLWWKKNHPKKRYFVDTIEKNDSWKLMEIL